MFFQVRFCLHCSTGICIAYEIVCANILLTQLVILINLHSSFCNTSAFKLLKHFFIKTFATLLHLIFCNTSAFNLLKHFCVQNFATLPRSTVATFLHSTFWNDTSSIPHTSSLAYIYSTYCTYLHMHFVSEIFL